MSMADHRLADLDVMQYNNVDGARTLRDRPVSRIQLGKNFSYPRPDGHAIRHEQSDSRSSVTSSGSLPGMTDSSDSEASAEDDYHYNTSASELWDSFWPAGTNKSHHRHKHQNSSISQSQTPDRFSLDYYKTTIVEGPDDDSVTITQASQEQPDTNTSQWPLSKPPLPRPNLKPARNTTSYSVYPKSTPLPTRITQLPPRISSMTPEPPSRLLKGSKSISHLKHRVAPPSLVLTPSTTPNTIISSQADVAAADSPARLRPSVSSYNIREKSEYHATTSPFPVPVPPIPDQLRSAPPQIERFVSVFDFDSDAESTSENETLAKRIARGLQQKKSLKDIGSKKADNHTKGHKKSASEKSSLSPEKKTAAAMLASGGSLGRKRGGSLGRMLGLKSNK
ncbi:hypothetical protein PFICI_02960 [Pestalotiopsis fici W106-1]|uniref:Uncharacterized protein n=1 Tax=Pestalotiopsis fici (strain W106-1 / CGMCC3.15140) TaxID=1229662 RepID=W3XFX5_PESFW|nr:uncharacterized protein PFICI_02960 [Pestalotiopsis fici W106-1]ETS84935.1 hypothetical protein PFICI_02960 [Pestalotiopsis fici W106-1]